PPRAASPTHVRPIGPDTSYRPYSFRYPAPTRHLHSLPTRRSSDLTPFRPGGRVTAGNSAGLTDGATVSLLASEQALGELGLEPRDRKSTRLNSSHQIISYAVLCLRKE